MNNIITKTQKSVVVYLMLMLSGVFTACANATDDSSLVLKPQPIHIKKTVLLTSLLNNYHYRKLPIADSLGNVVLDLYLNDLDGSKIYFLQTDIDQFKKYKNTIDDALKGGDLTAAYEIFNLYTQRVMQRIDYAIKNIDNLYDFSKDEQYDANRENVSWAKDEKELNQIWDKFLKSQILSLKLTGKEQKEISETIRGRYERFKKTMQQTNAEDVYEIYINTLMTAYDPHTSYFSPISSDNFNMQMRNSLEGIGAVLRSENDFTRIQEVRPGGPAFKSKMLNVNDKIIAVAQGDDGEFIDVVGWRLDEVVQKIRGPKGTVVRLKVIPAEGGANALPIEVRMVREKITFEEQSAQKQLITYNKDGKTYKIGVVSVPSFYFDFEGYQKGDPSYKSTTKDVKKLVEELKAEGINGLVIDLRDNGGGSLKEAIDLSGLFIKDGPVVQVRNSDGSVEVGRDSDPTKIWDGPMAVLVNRSSASASEIFAGAMQDYHRAIVIGEQTYGKGTVQSMIDVNKLDKNEPEKMGQINLTLAKFYRVTGSSTQHKGVTPDIELPMPYDKARFGESAEKSALTWDVIKGTKFTPYSDVTPQMLEKVNKFYQQRLQNDPHLRKLIADIEEQRKDRENTIISLNEEKRKIEQQEFEQRQNEKKKALESDQDPNKVKDAYVENAIEIIIQMIKINS
ncbi:MAG: tail-specific protease [Cytophagales bacterium]|nr:MAG: tail-specific protease [Cytophagales bacterium]